MNEQIEDVYHPRIADDILPQKLEESGAVYIKKTKMAWQVNYSEEEGKKCSPDAGSGNKRAEYSACPGQFPCSFLEITHASSTSGR